jgi:tripeptide aminopeptidase
MELMELPGPSGKEAAVMEHLIRHLQEAGADPRWISFDDAHRKSPAGGECGNLFLTLPGNRNLPCRLLLAHADTVPLCVGSKPVIQGQFIRSASANTGLGADDRAGAAALLTTACELLRKGIPHPPVSFVWTVQEEIGLYGSRFLDTSRLGQPALCFNWDGNEPYRVTIGATGARRLTIHVRGVAAHAGVAPETGVNAAVLAAIAISRLQRQGWIGLIRKGARTGTSNIGSIQGGQATNIVLPELRLEGEVRSHDVAFQRRIVRAFREAFGWAAQAVRSSTGRRGRVRFEVREAYRPFRLKEQAPVVREACRAIEALGLRPELYVSGGGLDANNLVQYGLPTVTLGAGQRHIHTTRERLHIPSYLRACQIALLLASGWTDTAPTWQS